MNKRKFIKYLGGIGALFGAGGASAKLPNGSGETVVNVVSADELIDAEKLKQRYAEMIDELSDVRDTLQRSDEDNAIVLSDEMLLEFIQDMIAEGTITVSANTIQINRV